MPTKDFGKFSKYSPKKEEIFFDVEKTIYQTVDLAEKLRLKGINLTLLSDDFFRETTENISASFMFTGNVIPPHNHDFFEINYVVSGKCIEYIGGNTFILDEGDFLLMPPSVYHAPNPVGNSRCVNILIKSDWIGNIEKRLIAYDLDSFLTRIQKLNTYMIFHAKNSKAFETANNLPPLFEKTKEHSCYRGLYAESLALKMLLELLECKYTEIFYSSPKPYASENVPKAILQYIKNNISTASLESTAEHFGYSMSHLSRLIKNHTGNGFASYIMLQRILSAEQLLSRTDIPIGKIPAMIGLESPEYFSRVFKKYNGVSPSEYRKKAK